MSGPRRNVDIAIIGLSCRFPGAATADEYWKNLCDGVESVTFFSDQELVAAGVDPSLVANPRYVKASPMLQDVEMFDASFFGYSPKDAALMDPQQRLFLEVSWEAFENAGYDPAGYPGKVGVLSTGGGVVASYLLAKLHHADFPGQTASTSHINNDKDFLSTRVSFKLNLRGPSFTIQSACSSSLVAVHQACQNLRFDECDMMLVGGSVVRVPQVEGYLAEKRNLYSLNGHCRPFDSDGQGTIFGSGVGAVLLKPLEKAVADRDHIFAVIKGTAANNDGSAKISYTAPSLGQQCQAVVDALELAGVSADSVGYVECHSTGTIVGDPLEIEALTMAFRKETKRKQYCAVGSVKGNIGHPEQAAGISGLIKTALVLHHKQIPPSINYETPNPRIDFASSPFYVNTELQDFPLTNTPRRAGLNCLGIGGTNTFAVLEEAPPTAVMRSQSPDRFPCLITLSAKSADALVARVEQLLNWLNDNPDAPIGDVCYTTNVSRSQFTFRFAAPARSVAELKKHLTAWLRAVAKDASSLQRTSHARIAFMFSGQGSQRAGMAAELYRTHSVFRNAMDRCHALAEPYLEKGLLNVIFAGDSDDALVNRTDFTQPALFAVEYALAALVKSWGMTPDAVIGHSLGEITAACAADVITLEDAMRLVTARGALMRGLPSGGTMASIFAEESVVRALIDKVAPDITVAAMNGPLNTVVSGDRDALRPLLEELDRRDISYRELQVSTAFHSPRTEPILDELENVAGQLKHNAPKLPLISNVTGELLAAAPDKSYWRRHTREAVRFGDGMLALAKLECRTFLEIGPHPVLLPLAQVCLGAKGKSSAWIATLNRQKSDADSITEMLVALYIAGHNLNWTAVHADASWRRIPLPTYPFQRQRHWIEDNTNHTDRARNAVERRLHPLVGARINSTPKEVRYEAHYGVQHTGYFADHRVLGTVVLPTTAELEAATVVGRMHFGTPRVSFDNAMHHQAMSFTNGEDRTVRVLVTPLKSDRASFRLVSAATEDSEVWHTHMTGTLRKSDVPSGSTFSTKDVQARCQQTLTVADLYDRLDKLGLEYGPSFRGIRELYLGQHEALTKVRLPDGLANTQYVMHPAFLDACLHAYPLVLDGEENAKSDRRNSYLPISLAGFRCYQDGIEEAWVHTRLRSVEKDDTQVIDIRIFDAAQQPVAELEGLTVRLLPLDSVQSPQAGTDDLFYRAAWRKSVRRAANSEKDRAPASWMIFADAKGVGVALASRLEAAGHHCHLVYRGDAFAQQGVRKWTVNERQPHDFRRLLEQFAASETLPCDGVVYLWGLDAPSLDGLTLARLKSGSEMMCRGALAVLHALDQTRSTNPRGRRLWFVTANTQKTEGQDQHVDPVQAPLWGLGRTAAIEYPGIWGGLIDLQLNGDRTPDIDLLAAELLDPDGETQIAISAGGQRNIPRFVRQSLAELPAQLPRVRGDATYLVTGGLGMLGRSVAKWLISKGAKHLVLTGRNASSEAAQELFSAAETNDAAIHVIAADISRDEDVSRLMQTISNEFPPLKGVVHSAGILDDGILAQLDWDRFARLFEPKVYGSWLLHEYTKSLELDFFILKSSLLSLLGSAGQGNYSASNTFLDSLAAHRRAKGLPATAINWSAWSGGGLATFSGARGEAMWSSLGVKFVSPALAMQAFDKLMHRDVDQIAVAIADWPTYAGRVGKPLFLAELLKRNEDFGSAKLAQGTFAPAAPPIAVNDETRQQLLSRLQQRIMAELGFADPIDPDRPLNEVGLDSLRSVTFANSLEDEFGIPVSIAELISGPTINQLVDHLFDLFAGIAKDEPAEPESAMTSATAVRTLAVNPPIAVAHIISRATPAAHGSPRSLTAEARIASDQFRDGMGLQQVTNGYAPDGTAINPAGNGNDPQAYPDVGMNEKTPAARWGNGAGTKDFGVPVFRPAGEVASRAIGKWLIAPRPNPNAKARLFCFPYAGGGLASFRAWSQRLDDSVEVVAVEPPGRGTRINETAVDDLDTFVERLLPEMVDWLDRPAAFFGHCLGGLTMFATLCALPEGCAHFIKHSFACGVKPPHLLKRRGEFEDNLVYDMMLHREFDISVPLYAQADEIFADMIRHFDIPAANKMLEIPTLRKVLLPTIRAEFGMAYNYEYQPVEPFSFPISSFVGDSDPWVSEEDSAGWGELTRGGFTNHVRKGSHFLMADDGKYILEIINNEFVNLVIQRDSRVLHLV
ncbi:MAG TPA: SDR family NAD(P)-dependent oxidoreductase [Pseudolabrys sp.]|nr:SDR family NAD(P)-dependent oxidoreductase [Pseudolabrys sp.]